MTQEGIRAIYSYLKFSFVESQLATLADGDRNATFILDALNMLIGVFTNNNFNQAKLDEFDKYILQSAVKYRQELISEGVMPEQDVVKGMGSGLGKYVDAFNNIINNIKTSLAITDQATLSAYNSIVQKSKLTDRKVDNYSYEYDDFFKRFNMIQDLYVIIENHPNVFDLKKDEISIDVAIFEFHQGITHLSRAYNFGGNTFNHELGRFKSHIRRASLDLVKLCLEQILIMLEAMNKSVEAKALRKEYTLIKAYEVVSVPSDQMPLLLQKYTECYAKYVEIIRGNL
jgi:hypothetical protein